MTRRGLRVRLLFLLLAVASACRQSSEPGGLRLGELVPVATHGVSTDIILPPFEESLMLLGDGWEQASREQAHAEGLWVIGTTARFSFYAAVQGAVVLEAEALTHRVAQEQSMQVDLNGEALAPVAMPGRWEKYELELPAAAVRRGWNSVTLIFGRTVRPSEVEDGSRDDRPLAARFRRLRVRSGLGRALWVDRPTAPVVTRIDGDRDDAFTISMPTDSDLSLYLLPRGPASLTGVVESVGIDGDIADIAASIELLDEAGAVHELLTYEQGETGGEHRFVVSLREWADQPVQLSLRSWGRTNGFVRWHDLTLSGGPDATVAEVTRPAHLVVPPRSGRLGRPDVIVILLDAARADAFHSAEPPTPHAAALAAAGTRFSRARAPAPWTGQSVPSLLTGRYPGAIGVERWGSQIPVGVPTLGELLGQEGYHTVVWSQHNVYRGNRSFRRGFDEEISVRSNVLADRSLLPSPDELFVEDRPSFVLIHVLPPHGPYQPPEPFQGRRSAWYAGDFLVSAAALNRSARAVGRRPSSEDIRYVRSRYDENVEFADHLVGRVVRMLREAGRYDDALVMLTSDHGEGFFEHGRFLHTRLLYDEFLRIPLIVKWPVTATGFAAEVDVDVSLVDLAPTIVDGLGLSQDLAGFQGRTLLPTTFDGFLLTRAVFSQTRGIAAADAKPRPGRALVSGQYKMIVSEVSGTIELFALERDPNETLDLEEAVPLRAGLLHQQVRLQQYRNALALVEHATQQDEVLDPETIRNLRALGYLR